MTFTVSGEEQKTLSYRDLDAVFEWRRQGFPLALVTGEDTAIVDVLAQRLRAEFVIRGAKDKVAGLKELTNQSETPLESICYVGDSERDAPAMRIVGVSMAPFDAHPHAKQAARLVLSRRGGAGAVAEAVDNLLRARRLEASPASPGQTDRPATADDESKFPGQFPEC